MKQWNGLMKREWVAMKGWLYGTVGAAILITLIIPLFIAIFFKESVDGVVISFLPLWLVVSLIMPISILLSSLKKEMDRPDIWLHSPVSIFKLFGAKAVFASGIGLLNLAIATFVGLIQLKLFSPIPDLTFGGLIGFGSTFIFSVFLTSLLAMCMVLFIRVLYLVMEPRMKGFTIPILIVFVFGASWVYERIRVTSFYEKITTFGPFANPLNKDFTMEGEGFFFQVNTTVLHTGSFLVAISLTIFLFVLAAVLFEKKVRL